MSLPLTSSLRNICRSLLSCKAHPQVAFQVPVLHIGKMMQKCTARHLVCCVRCLCEPGLALLASYKFYKFYKWLALHGGVVLSLQGHNTRSCWISLESGQIWSPSLIDSLRHFCKPGVDLCQSQSQSSRISKISVHRVVTLLHQESLAPCHMPCRQDLLKPSPQAVEVEKVETELQ